jgi:hypothetical protein
MGWQEVVSQRLLMVSGTEIRREEEGIGVCAHDAAELEGEDDLFSVVRFIKVSTTSGAGQPGGHRTTR